MRLIAIATVLALCAPALSSQAQQLVAVRNVAARAGYHYSWSPDNASIVLSRSGIVVVLRPGAPVYQVNDHQEVADAAPAFAHGDLFVTSSLAAHLQALAERADPAPQATDALSPTDTFAHQAISLEARQLQGAEALAVDGSAPPNAPVIITLLAIVSADIPTILVSRHELVTDVNGRYSGVIPVASAYERGTLLRVVATSVSGAGSASAQLVTSQPNAGIDVPLEHE